MLSILSYVYEPPICLPWRSVYSSPLPIFIGHQYYFNWLFLCIHTRSLCFKNNNHYISKTSSICNRVQPRGGAQIRICNGVQHTRCPGNIRKIYIGCPHPHKPELEDRTHGVGPLRAVLYSNGCAANFWHGHLTYL